MRIVLSLRTTPETLDSPLILQSDRNVTVNARNELGQLTGQLTVGSQTVEAQCQRFEVLSSESGKVLFSADKDEISIGAGKLRVTGTEGAVFGHSVETPLIRAGPSQDLKKNKENAYNFNYTGSSEKKRLETRFLHFFDDVGQGPTMDWIGIIAMSDQPVVISTPTEHTSAVPAALPLSSPEAAAGVPAMPTASPAAVPRTATPAASSARTGTQETGKDGTIWKIINPGVDAVGRRASQNVLTETSGPTSYAKCNVEALSDFHLLIVINHIHR
ncbi:UNVERIFIED_CONTAM: hypothetical protein FKN15_068169 [Acipenser sinensis]